MKLIIPLLAVALPLVLSACSKDVPCPVCYQDEWSREPFPGQAKQHIKPLTPDEAKDGAPVSIHNEFIDTVPASVPLTERW